MKIFIGEISWGCGTVEVVAIRAETEEEAKKILKAEYPNRCRYPQVDELKFGEWSCRDLAYVGEYG